MKNRRVFTFLAAAALTGLAGCGHVISTGGSVQKGPVGIGSGVDELKGSPCACLEIPQALPDGFQGASI